MKSSITFYVSPELVKANSEFIVSLDSSTNAPYVISIDADNQAYSKYIKNKFYRFEFENPVKKYNVYVYEDNELKYYENLTEEEIANKEYVLHKVVSNPNNKSNFNNKISEWFNKLNEIYNKVTEKSNEY